AFFCLLQMKLEEAENLSRQIASKSANKKGCGLAHHNLGVVYFYKTELKEAKSELKKSIRARHLFRPNSYITLGLVVMRERHFEAASRWLLRAIHIFNLRRDTDRLCVALSKFGLIYKRAGHLKEARTHYQQSLHLSRLNRN